MKKRPSRKSTSRAAKADRILVVDDNKGIREIVASMLTTAGYRCRAVPGGRQALKLLASGHKFDLITSDIGNEPMDGISLLDQLKRKYPDIPVLMVTAGYGVSSVLEAMRSGAYGYLLKPFEREQLYFAVQRALEYCRLKAENRALRAKLARLAGMG